MNKNAAALPGDVLSQLTQDLAGNDYSIPDQLAAVLDHDDSDQASQSQQTQQLDQAVRQTDDGQYVIKHNGQEITLTQEELLANAQKGFDYTTKTQQLADQRKQYEMGMQQLALQQQQFNAIMQQQQRQSQQAAPQVPSVPTLDPEKYDEEFIKLYDTVMSLKGTVEKVPQLEQMASSMQQRQQAQVIDAAEQHIQNVHKSIFNRPLGPVEEQRLGAAMQQIRVDVTNPASVEMLYRYTFKDEIANQLQTNVLNKLKADGRSGILRHGLTSPGDNASQQLQIGTLPPMTRPTVVDNYRAAAQHLKDKYGVS